MPGRLAQQRMTLSDLELTLQASRAISAVAELLVWLLGIVYKTQSPRTHGER